jgi:predicted DNA-binding transcriptional regulator AlpA
MSESSTSTRETRTERLLTIAEVANWLGMAEGTLRYWRHVHRGPRSLTVGGAVRYRPSDIEEWLEHGAKQGTPS